MKSKSVKYNVMPLGVGTVYEPPLRIRRRLRAGFTLIEILVAVTIIVTIVSMVYGSYFATAKSADAYKARMTTSGQTQKVLRWMAQQIRCSYVGKISDDTDLEGTGSSTNTISKGPVIYFSYESDSPGSGTLHLVTTHRLFCQDENANGLFDIAYKYNKNIGSLSLSQRRFVGTPQERLEDRNWRELLVNVESLELDFFDGRQWYRTWDFERKKKIPVAVKIGITSKDENDRQCRYSTIAYLGCSGNPGRETLSETSVGK
ncbi:MAG: type II secretion system protein GspJ [Planctomycetota bacterium]